MEDPTMNTYQSKRIRIKEKIIPINQNNNMKEKV